MRLSIEFEICRDPHLREQYFQLREQCFRRELGISDFDGSEDERDRQGEILIARIGDRCIGGARIVPGVAVADQIGELELASDACCMWERFVMDPAVRTVQLVRDFCAQLIEVSRRIGYDIALVLSSHRNARFYRQCHSALGVGFKIHARVPQCATGSFAGLEHYLSIAQLNNTVRLRVAA